MGDLIRRSKAVMICAAIIVTLLAYFGVFRPMDVALKEHAMDEFVLLTDSKFSQIETAINHSVQSASGLSNYATIQDAIFGYYEQSVTIEELSEYTGQTYESAASELDNLLYTQRVVDGKTVAEYGDASAAQAFEEIPVNAGAGVRKRYADVDGVLMLEVVSPITQGTSILGHDLLVYMLSTELGNASYSQYSASVLAADSYQDFLESAQLQITKEHISIYESGKNTVGIAMLEDNIAFVIKVETVELFETATGLIWWAAIIWCVVLLFLLIALDYYVIRFARNKIRQIENSANKYKGMAYRDKLTGAFSRMYLDVWNTTFRPRLKASALVMIDIDNFKEVNDKYGHLKGDEVIVAVAEAAKESIRRGDSLIRFGGDEFLLLLENMGEEKARTIVSRLAEYVANIKKFPFVVSISCGIAVIEPDDSIDDILRAADKYMYEVKKLKKQRQIG